MTGLHRWLENLWWTRQPPAALRLLARAYGAASRRHLQRRALHPIQPPLPLISVGNITAGGSGKTPFTIWLAGALKKHGRAPVILCRGDGGKNPAPVLVQPDHPASEVGDEARLLFELAGCPVIAGRDRIRGSELAVEHGDIIILDDGFQYRHLARCCDIVLVPTEGVGNGFGIPAGPLREPLTALDRADVIVRSGHGTALPLQKQKPEWHWHIRPAGLVDIMQTHADAPNFCLAASGIARPGRFLDDLDEIGVLAAESMQFPDHHPFSKADVEALLARKLPVVVTGKDAVKLRPLWPAETPLWVLQQEPDEAADLLENILIRLPGT